MQGSFTSLNQNPAIQCSSCLRSSIAHAGAFPSDGTFLSYGASGKDPQNPGDEDVQHEEDQGEPPPSKIVTHQRNVQLRAKVMVLDFSGLSDIQSMAMILGNVAPRHLILVNGSDQVGFCYGT